VTEARSEVERLQVRGVEQVSGLKLKEVVAMQYIKAKIMFPILTVLMLIFPCSTFMVVSSGCEEAEPQSVDSEVAVSNLDPNDQEGILLTFQDPSTDPTMAEVDTLHQPLGVCIRTPLGPGKVKWGMANPRAAGYSVAPESRPALIWAVAPEQSIDAVYRSSWGCGSAFKVPDHCTATVGANGSLSCCCNAAASLVFGTCRWVNTMDNSVDGRYFADCPLR
jgi:hypothetical protein